MISTSQFYPEVSFNAVISACEKGKMWQRTFDLWHYMCCTESLQPDLITYNALLKLRKGFSKRWGIQTKQVINVMIVFFCLVVFVGKKTTMSLLSQLVSQKLCKLVDAYGDFAASTNLWRENELGA